MRQIRDESALEAPTDESRIPKLEYLRAKFDPYVLISCRDGVTYQRTDGAKWEHAAYAVSLNAAGRSVCEPGTAYCDRARYEPATQSAAA